MALSQLWHHVRALVDRIGLCGDQLHSLARILRDDGKNYHVWSQRQWVCQRFAAWEGELEFVDHLLKIDIRTHIQIIRLVLFQLISYANRINHIVCHCACVIRPQGITLRGTIASL